MELLPDELDSIHVNSSSDSKATFVSACSSNENSSSEKRHSNESFTSGSCTLLEDIEAPSSFNSSTICVEKILSISDESSQDSKNIVEISGHCSSDFTPGTLLDNDTSYILAGSEEVLEALNRKNQKSSKKPSSPSSKLTFLDLDNINDSLLADLTHFMCKENELQDSDGPSMSTPKNCDRSSVYDLTSDCKANLNFNGTFDKGPMQKENGLNEKVDVALGLNFNGTFDKGPLKVLNNRMEVSLESEECKIESRKDFNTTYDKQTGEVVNGPVLNVTFETRSPKKTEEPLNRTFEVVGNGSFIIDGQCTTLMDMESNALNTVLGSTPNTPVSRGRKSFPDVKKLDKSTLKKRLSLLKYQLMDEATSSSQISIAKIQEESDEKTSKIDSQNILRNQFTKEEILSRLRKNTQPTSSSSVSGPMKAVPIAAVYQKGQVTHVQEVEKRATSTPTDLKETKQKNVNRLSKSSEKEDRNPSLPSFGSVSSIGTDGVNSRDICSEDFMATPEVFRHRNKSLRAHVTSTPTLVSSSLKFDADLGLESIPTPIIAPKPAFMKPIKIEKNINNSYICEAKKERLDTEEKGRLSFATSSEGGSPDSIKKENSGVDKRVLISKDIFSQVENIPKTETLIKKDKKSDLTSKQKTSFAAGEDLDDDVCQIPVDLKQNTSFAAIEDLKDYVCQMPVKGSNIGNPINTATNKDLQDNECDTVLTSTEKEGMQLQNNGFSNYMSEAERKFENSDNKVESNGYENESLQTKDVSLKLMDSAIPLSKEECINSVNGLDNNNLTIANEDQIHNFTNEIKCETITTEESGKNQKFEDGNINLSKTSKLNETGVKNTSRASLSKVTNSTNKTLNSSNKAAPKLLPSAKRLGHQPLNKPLSSTKRLGHQPPNLPLSSTKRLSHQPPNLPLSSTKRLSHQPPNLPLSSTKRLSHQPPNKPLSSSKELSHQTMNKVQINATPTITKSGPQPVRSTLKPKNTTDNSLTFKKEPVLKQETQSKIKPQVPRPILKPLNARSLPIPKVENKLPNSIPNLRKPPSNARTLLTPKVENSLQKVVPDQSRVPSNNARKSFSNSKLTFSSANKENSSANSHLGRKSGLGSGSRISSTRTGSQPVTASFNSTHKTEGNISVIKEEPVLKQEKQSKSQFSRSLNPRTTSRIENKPQTLVLNLPKRPSNARATPRVVNKLQTSVPNLPKHPPNSSTTTRVENKPQTLVANLPKLPPKARTPLIPKVDNYQQNSVPKQSKTLSNNIGSNLPIFKSTFCPTTKNNSVNSRVPRKSIMGSGIRPPSTIPLPSTINFR